MRMMTLNWLGISLLLLAPGCSSKREPAAAPASETARWNWEAYPLLDRMRLAMLPCQLLPKSFITFHAPLAGVLRVYVNQPQTNLPAHFVWAEFEPAQFAAEAEAVEDARVRLEERERLQLELEVPRQKLRLERDFEEAGRQVAMLNLFSTNPALAEAAMSVGGKPGSPLRPEALGKAQLELRLLRQNLDYLEATNLAVLGIDLPAQKSDWQRRKLEFERRQAQARLKMPFPGQLTLTLPLTEGVEEYPVNLGQELAVARDLNLIRVRVVLANPAWTGLPAEKLEAVLRLPDGGELRAPYAFQKIERAQQREDAVYYFQFPPEKTARAARLIGTDIPCEIWLALPQPARLVPKLSLVLQHSGAFQSRDWAHGVAAAWPGARLAVEGQTDLAIVPPGSAPGK